MTVQVCDCIVYFIMSGAWEQENERRAKLCESLEGIVQLSIKELLEIVDTDNDLE